MSRIVGAAILLAATSLTSTVALAQGCAMCGSAVTSAKDPLARGMFLSILLMLLVPNLLIVSMGGWLVYVYRRAARTPHSPPGGEPPAGRTTQGDSK